MSDLEISKESPNRTVIPTILSISPSIIERILTIELDYQLKTIPVGKTI